MKRLTKLFCVLTLCLWGLFSPMAWSCPSCKDNLDNSVKSESTTGKGPQLAKGYSMSVLWMLAFPFTIVGGGIFLAYRHSKKFSK